ncbi:SOS response-associated peptidase family protein [uncultured Pseudomonas sp.]|uniref:SOS response-associated peptidase family protein n=1 Tax=uncultured Pseudomonas sp. TaxID=114707 RepID=UPI003454ECDA
MATGKYFRSIWPHRALVMADGWYEWVKNEADPKKKLPYFIRLKSGAPMFFAHWASTQAMTIRKEKTTV